MTIASGSSGNCTYVGSENTGILVDVGVSKKKILDALQDVDRTFADINGIVITHEHIDHIRGLGVISRAYGIPIYATEATIEEIKYTTSLGTLDYGLFHSIQPDEPFMVGNIEILAGAGFIYRREWINLSNTVICWCTSFSYVLLRLKNDFHTRVTAPCGVSTNQIKSVQGMGEANPIADNSTAAGRQENRRVEIYLYASQQMIQQAEAGTL